MTKKQKTGIFVGALAMILVVASALLFLNWGSIQAWHRQQKLQGYWLREYSKKNSAQIIHFDGKNAKVISTSDDYKDEEKVYINPSFEKVGSKIDGKIKWVIAKPVENSDDLKVGAWTYTKISKAKVNVYLDAVKQAKKDAQTYEYGNYSSLNLGEYEVGKDLKSGGVKLQFDYEDDNYESNDNGTGEILIDGKKKAVVKSTNDSPRIILKKGQILELRSDGINSPFMLKYE